jgi:CPA2 family monovalent cation:H+ antiporter-2
MQDIMLASVLTILQFSSKRQFEASYLILSSVVCVLIFLLLRSIRNRNFYQIPFIAEMEKDHELQVFAGALMCLGYALQASLAGISAPVGSL